MNFQDLVAAVSERSGCGEKWAKLVVRCTLDIISEEVLERSGRVTLSGFGTFKTRLWEHVPRGTNVIREGSGPKTWLQMVFKCSNSSRKQIK